MIPIHLTLSGFLSYREPVEIDFTTFDLACIVGPNGSGKSSLLDAITWVLFGQARKRDDSLINNKSDTAEVSLVFEYENNIYRVLRSKTRDKTAVLDFYILQQVGIPVSNFELLNDLPWKPLTEHTLRTTEARIRDTLRLDYETFINASFFLQGKADQFTKQRPGDRKRILSSILGLEVWEQYRLQASERRRVVQNEISNLEGRLEEIVAELEEEASRKQLLNRLKDDLDRITLERETAEANLAQARQIAASLEEQRKLVAMLKRNLHANQDRLDGLEGRLNRRRMERTTYRKLLEREKEIESSYKDWQNARHELEKWDTIARQYRQVERKRNQPLTEIQTARARLEQELGILLDKQKTITNMAPEIERLREQIEIERTNLKSAEQHIVQRKALETELAALENRIIELETNNKHLKAEMLALKERISRLEEAEGASCPLCGQALSPQERQALIDELQTEGTQLAERYRENNSRHNEFERQKKELSEKLAPLSDLDGQVRQKSELIAKFTSQLEILIKQQASWESVEVLRIKEIERILAESNYAQIARQTLAEIDAELDAIGYDAAQHEAVRAAEAAGRRSEVEMNELDTARTSLNHLEREISDLGNEIDSLRAEMDEGEKAYQEASERLSKVEKDSPDVHTIERGLLDIRERENRLRLEVGAAEQKVAVLDTLKQRRNELEMEREELAGEIGQYRQLERAFSKDGVPALLIEQALPEIESKANKILDRLSDGNMTVQFTTQAEYKDKKRSDKKETLDILINDGSSQRDYEMYSGGEAFRVNFAIRLALSEVLAQRAGARLQTLVIDEGFGSQDAHGRQRLIEAINMVKDDFAKILVITHIEELKDVFPTRIEVEKTLEGSIVSVSQ